MENSTVQNPAEKNMTADTLKPVDKYTSVSELTPKNINHD